MAMDIGETSAISYVMLPIVIIASLIYWSMRRPSGMPPGPIGLPIVGSMLSMRKRPQIQFKEMIKTYGNIIAVKIGQRWMIVLNQIDVVREALLRKPVEFAGRPDHLTNAIFSVNQKDIVFTTYSASWKLHRKLGHSAIRNFATGRKLDKIVHEVTEKIGSRLDKHKGQPIDPKSIVCLGIYNILGTLCFAKKYEFDDPRLNWFLEISHRSFEALGIGLLADFFPFLRHFPTEAARVTKLRKVITELSDYLYSELNIHRDSFDKENIRDIYDSLLLAQKEAREEENEVADSLTDKHLAHTIGDLFGAGTDTTIVTLHWTIAIMAEFPDIQNKAAEEIENVIGHNRLPVLSDRGNLPYTEATLMEVLRFSSIIPLGIPHSTTSDVMLDGYVIPKGALVVVNHYALHFDEKIWNGPKKFNPDHFLDESGSVRQHPNSFLPFSAGRRSCLGESLAKAELFLIFTWFLQNFQMAKVPGKENESLLNVKSEEAFQRELRPYEVVMNRRVYEI